MSRGARPEGLSRRHRFRGEDCFRPLLRSPRKHSGSLAVLHVTRAVSSARFGIAVGKRSAKSAVQRNLIKRRARELFRRHPLKRSRLDVVVTLTHRFEPRQVDLLMVELSQLMDRANATA
jgi:ribonuclease P protein component